MDAKKEKNLAAGFPVWTVAVLVGAVTAYLFPEVASLLIYQREAVLRGEFWRLLSAYLVHFDKTHLFYDLLAFGLAGCLIETNGCRQFGRLYLCIALVIGLFLVLAKPEVTSYGGVSGQAVGAFVYLGLYELGRAKPRRFWGWLLLSVVTVKIAFEFYVGDSLLFYSAPRMFVPVWESHALGSCTALGVFVVQKLSHGRSLGRAKAAKGLNLEGNFI
jgi:rhomboid family GlyGly-CTERM serine protease